MDFGNKEKDKEKEHKHTRMVHFIQDNLELERNGGMVRQFIEMEHFIKEILSKIEYKDLVLTQAISINIKGNGLMEK